MSAKISEIIPKLRLLAVNLGPEWSFGVGRADAYGLSGMEFAQIRNRARQVSLRVWHAGTEIRVAAFLGVSYEASDETWFQSTEELVEFVAHLCRGEYDRRDGAVWVELGRRRHALTEWTAETVDVSDPWGDGI